MTQTQDIRRHRDGSIDFDFYRARATALRAQAMRDAFKPKAFLGFTLITAAMVAAVVIAAFAPAHRVYCPYCTPTNETYMPGGSFDASVMSGRSNPTMQLSSTSSQLN